MSQVGEEHSKTVEFASRFILPPTSILNRRFHLVTGKGGVGKSTVCMTIAFSLAAQGKRVLLCEIDEREQLTHSFAVQPSQGEICALDLVTLPGEIWGVNMQLNRALSEYGELKLKVRALSQLFTENPLTKALISVIPGVEDLIYLGKAFHHERERTRGGELSWDAVILDAPATGHGLTLIGLPKLIRELVPIGNLKREADEMWALLSDPQRTAIHVVTRPELLPTQEAFELATSLQSELSLRIDVFWLNQKTMPQSITTLISEHVVTKQHTDHEHQLDLLIKQYQTRLTSEAKAQAVLTDFAQKHEIPIASLPKILLEVSHRPLVDALLKNLFDRTIQAEIRDQITNSNALANPTTNLQQAHFTFTGKTKLITLIGGGGVGKTTVSAALALAFAQSGLKVALITIDPAKRLAQALGLDELGGTLQTVSLHPQLDAMMLERSVTAQHLIQRYASSEEIATQLSEHPYFKAFSGAMAGAQEYMALHEVNLALNDGKYDVVVLDTPPGRHALDVLDASSRLTRAVHSPALALWAKASRDHRMFLGKSLVVKAFGKLTSTAFIGDLTSFLALFMDILKGLEKDGTKLIQRCQQGDFILITTLDETQIRVAEQAREALESRGMNVSALVLNRANFESNEILDDYTEKLSIKALEQLKVLVHTLERGNEAEIKTVLSQKYPKLTMLSKIRIPEQINAEPIQTVQRLSKHLLTELKQSKIQG